MPVDVTILTPTLSWREEMLRELRDSVAAQTIQPKEHLVELDDRGLGVARMLNRLLAKADTTWVSPVADDDLLHPRFFERLFAAKLEHPHCDVYYTWCHVTGRGTYDPCKPYDGVFWDVPVNGLFRRELLDALGGWGDGEDLHSDILLLHKIQEEGGKFFCIEERLWTWRFHGRNLCLGGV